MIAIVLEYTLLFILGEYFNNNVFELDGENTDYHLI
jgi:hypothetical protein